MENVNFVTWTSVLTWFDLSQVNAINEVSVILRSRLLQGQIVSLTFLGGGALTERHFSFVF